MLDQPVPNPIAKNPNIHTHKVFASVGLILIGTIIAVAGIWWYVDGKNTDNSAVDETTTKVSTSSSTPATSSAAKAETKGWDNYKSKDFNYSIDYPNSWGVNVSSGTHSEQYGGTKYELVSIKAVKSGDTASVTVSGNPMEVTFSLVCTDEPGSCKTEQVELAGLKWTKTSYSGSSKIDLYQNDDKKLYIFVTPLDQSETVNQILSTFKFL